MTPEDGLRRFDRVYPVTAARDKGAREFHDAAVPCIPAWLAVRPPGPDAGWSASGALYFGLRCEHS